MEIIDKHECKTCNKSYSSYSSLWNHTKNIHNKKNLYILNNSDNNLNKSENNLKNINCRFCNKEYHNTKSRWSHEQKCKIILNNKEKQINDIKIAEINSNEKIKLAEINKEIKIAEIELAKINSNKEIELKKLEIKKENSLVKQKTNSNPTIKKINRILQNKINMNKSNNNNINSNNTNNIQNNIVHNHFKIEPFGKEKILDIITDKEKRLIISHGCESVDKLIEITNTGKYDQFKNIIITNNRDNNLYILDDKTGIFIIRDKSLALNNLLTNRLDDVEEIYNDLDEKNKINNQTKKILSSFFAKMSSIEDKPFIDENSNKEYKNYLEYRITKINNILFNNQDKILSDVSLAINDDNEHE
jgi:hypothetical protein